MKLSYDLSFMVTCCGCLATPYTLTSLKIMVPLYPAFVRVIVKLPFRNKKA